MNSQLILHSRAQMFYMKQISTLLLLMMVAASSCKKLTVACIRTTPSEDSIYANVPFEISAYCSQNADSYSWFISDSTVSTDAKFTHTFDTLHLGLQTITLTVTGTTTEERTLAVNVKKQ